MRKYKVGDVVKVIKSDHPIVIRKVLGQVGTISFIDYEDQSYFVKFKHLSLIIFEDEMKLDNNDPEKECKLNGFSKH